MRLFYDRISIVVVVVVVFIIVHIVVVVVVIACGRSPNQGLKWLLHDIMKAKHHNSRPLELRF